MEKLYNALQNITETFKDAVPVEYAALPVIRYTRVNENPSLYGDDTSQEWADFYQIDLYDRNENEAMKEQIKRVCETNYWRITGIQETNEQGNKRYLFDIKIEE